MVEDFSGLSTAVDALVAEVNEAIADLANLVPVDNQPAIDAITAKVSAAGDALKAALPAPAAPAAPATGTGSTDVTP